MKKIIVAGMLLLQVSAAFAQETFEPLKDRQLYFDVLNIAAIVSVIYLISSFILQFVRQYLGHKLKSKIIDRQTPEAIVQQLVVPEKREKGAALSQWASVLAGLAAGLFLMQLARPLGLHSLAILAAGLAAGCAGAHYLTRKHHS